MQMCRYSSSMISLSRFHAHCLAVYHFHHNCLLISKSPSATAEFNPYRHSCNLLPQICPSVSVGILNVSEALFRKDYSVAILGRDPARTRSVESAGLSHELSACFPRAAVQWEIQHWRATPRGKRLESAGLIQHFCSTLMAPGGREAGIQKVLA